MCAACGAPSVEPRALDRGMTARAQRRHYEAAQELERKLRLLEVRRSG